MRDPFTYAISTNQELAKAGAKNLLKINPNYKNLNNAYNSQTLFISHVETSKIRDSVIKELNPILHIGFLDFEIKTYRYPRL